ncbi:hypothetical protein Tco_0059315 [Tanacetum coccineum]
MDDLIRNRNVKLAASQQEIATLKQTLSNYVKENESLSTTLTVFKTESKEKESKYIDKEIILEKQNKELKNIICKMYRSTQAMYMLIKPQVFYDDTHKQALGYQNPFHLIKVLQIKPTLYDGSVIAKKHDVISVVDDEETLILEEESRSKMLDKQNDLISIKQNFNISLIDYSKLNNLKEDFCKRFVTQQELSTEQAFWLKHLNYNSDTSVKSHTPVRIKAPSELPKISLVNESLKKLKYHFASFDKVVKKRTTSDAITTDEITEVQTIFNQMEAVIDQCSVDKNAFEIQIKQLHIDNDQLLNQIMSQEILNIAVNSVDILDISKSCVNECSKCLELETELLKKKILIEKDVYDKLFKSYSTLEKHCISLELATQLNQEIFQKDNSVKNDIDEIETINIELEHSVAKSLSENENLRKEREHLKSICEDQFDSIKKTRVRSKEHFDSLIAQINAKYVANSDLIAQLQEKVFAIAALKNELKKLKVKILSILLFQHLLPPRLLQECSRLNLEPLAPKLLKNKDAHIDYIKHSRDHADTL